MKLSEAAAGDVVRNLSNQNFYRFERPEADRARIRPLELFPNGLLIVKPTDTTVEADLPVELIGSWSEGMVVSGAKPKHSREVYEKERARLQAQLVELEAEILTAYLKPGGLGSHMNRVKACRLRLLVLEAGLEDLQIEPIQIDMHKISVPPFKLQQTVILPSGRPGSFLGLLPQGSQLLATVAIKAQGAWMMLQVAPEALKPVSCLHMATV